MAIIVPVRIVQIVFEGKGACDMKLSIRKTKIDNQEKQRRFNLSCRAPRKHLAILQPLSGQRMKECGVSDDRNALPGVRLQPLVKMRHTLLKELIRLNGKKPACLRIVMPPGIIKVIKVEMGKIEFQLAGGPPHIARAFDPLAMAARDVKRNVPMTENIQPGLNGAAQRGCDDEIDMFTLKPLAGVLGLAMAQLGQTRVKMAGILARSLIMSVKSRLAMPDEQNLGHVGSFL